MTLHLLLSSLRVLRFHLKVVRPIGILAVLAQVSCIEFECLWSCSAITCCSNLMNLIVWIVKNRLTQLIEFVLLELDSFGIYQLPPKSDNL